MVDDEPQFMKDRRAKPFEQWMDEFREAYKKICSSEKPETVDAMIDGAGLDSWRPFYDDLYTPYEAAMDDATS